MYHLTVITSSSLKGNYAETKRNLYHINAPMGLYMRLSEDGERNYLRLYWPAKARKNASKKAQYPNGINSALLFTGNGIPIARKMISDHNKIIRPAEGFINKTDLQYLMEFNAEYIRILKRNPLLKLQKKKNYTDFGFMNYLHVGRNLFEDIMKGRSLCSFQAPEGTIIAYKMWFEKISRVREGCGLKG